MTAAEFGKEIELFLITGQHDIPVRLC